jgi:hypothetical protein
MPDINNIFPIEKSDYYQYYLLEKQQINDLQLHFFNHSGVCLEYSHAQWLWIMKYKKKWLPYFNSGILPLFHF